ncbi:winged helix DNA-binding domain-containing protein [Pyxidicoccus xibeiensis]|uniref:winged helix DNA-binding domain-containing protein n=1 Tax=Pyxidicoccus xibeiensis TaxID=2906759 RepID=UPI0020A7AB21|nr:winged helix DNA-binding domain-containing protein [Pyxidicoccus xibeiensis]MCP3145059.1 winged helix DNA-binding domain-containing protein [Pyxidicoccus xibeiensis]
MLPFFLFPMLPLAFQPADTSAPASARVARARTEARAAPSRRRARTMMPTRKPAAGVTTRRGASRPTQVLSQRALNRALLERQLLLRRSKRSIPEVVEHLIGLQAQAPNPPYYGLWTRLEDFHQDALASRLLDRSLVRIVLMRGTIHLVTARDALLLRPLVNPFLERALFTGSGYGRNLDGVDLKALVAAGRALVEARPLTLTELGAALGERWPDTDTASLAQAIRLLVPLVQVPPRGIWGVGGNPACTTLESWVGKPLDAAPSVDDVVLRYLAAFGPASTQDIQAWSGLTRLGEVTERLRPRLRTFVDEQGRELFDLPDAPRPDPETPAPVRFLPEFDNVLLSHADRTRIISEEDRKRIATRNGMVPGAILVDGFFHGTWKLQQHRGTTILHIEPHRRLSAQDRAALSAEGARLLSFAAPEAKTHDVQFSRPA